MAKKSLQDRAKEFSTLLPFMEGLTKGETDSLLDKVVTINEYGFLTDSKDGEDHEYVCFTVKEDSKCFYFGGKVLTENLRELENDGYHEEITKKGLPVILETRKSKNKREYTAVTFYPAV